MVTAPKVVALKVANRRLVKQEATQPWKQVVAAQHKSMVIGRLAQGSTTMAQRAAACIRRLAQRRMTIAQRAAACTRRLATTSLEQATPQRVNAPPVAGRFSIRCVLPRAPGGYTL